VVHEVAEEIMELQKNQMRLALEMRGKKAQEWSRPVAPSEHIGLAQGLEGRVGGALPLPTYLDLVLLASILY
jgi:VIT1/CCC1 family predicted Fe2+/Mn2+ transporter